MWISSERYKAINDEVRSLANRLNEMIIENSCLKVKNSSLEGELRAATQTAGRDGAIDLEMEASKALMAAAQNKANEKQNGRHIQQAQYLSGNTPTDDQVAIQALRDVERLRNNLATAERELDRVRNGNNILMRIIEGYLAQRDVDERHKDDGK